MLSIQFKSKLLTSGLVCLLLILLLSACNEGSNNSGVTPTAIPENVQSSNTRGTSITAIATSTSTPTQIVALLPTDTPLAYDNIANTPVSNASGIARTIFTPQISTPTITPIIPTPKKFSPTPNPSLSPAITTVSPGKTITPSGLGGDTQEFNSLKNTKVSFLTAYNRAAKAVLAIQPAAKIVLAQANYFTATRTGWSFYFVWLPGSKMYVATFDSTVSSIAINDTQAPILIQDAGQIQMEKVLDSPALVAKVAATGIPTSIPIDSVYFERYGTPPVPAYVCTNGIIQKQLVINAYTGQIIKNEFAK